MWEEGAEYYPPHPPSLPTLPHLSFPTPHTLHPTPQLKKAGFLEKPAFCICWLS
ncbi:MAG: hypothetical protein F6J93_05445 [Oscillatoria sp. SIO1A7]|nr:hypothetical protein [Oscillatoria sp. SIO1A7]